MEKVDDVLKDYQVARLTEKPIVEFCNWLFGISIGICSLLIVDLNYSVCISSRLDKIINIIAIIISLGNCFFAGYCRYQIFIRDIGINTIQDKLNKLVRNAYEENKEKPVVKPEFDVLFKDWLKEQDKIVGIAKNIKQSSFITIITVITTTSFIIYINF